MTDRRQRIIDSAATCFMRAGYSDTSIDRIAEECGVVKQTIYNHFDNKDTLFVSAIEARVQQVAPKIDFSWANLEPEHFFFNVAHLQLEIFRKAGTGEFLRLAVKEYRRFPAIRILYAEHFVNPVLNFVSKYAQERLGASAELANVASWCLRGVASNYATLLNITGREVVGYSDFCGFIGRTFTNTLKYCVQHELDLTDGHLANIVESLGTTEKAFIETYYKGELNSKSFRTMVAALEVFSKKGFGDASMDEIAELASVSKQTVYSQFRSKNALYKGACELMLNSLPSFSEALLQDESIDPDFLERYRKAVFMQTDTEWMRDFIRLAIAESNQFPDEANLALGALYNFGVDSMTQWLENHCDLPEPQRIILGLLLRGSLTNYALLQHIFAIDESLTINPHNFVEFFKFTLAASKGNDS